MSLRKDVYTQENFLESASEVWSAENGN